MSLIQSLVAALAALVLSVVLFGASSVHADGAADATEEKAEVVESSAEKKRRSKMVCKRERKTGSRVRSKVCRSVGQIEDRAESDRTSVDLMTRNASPGNLQ